LSQLQRDFNDLDHQCQQLEDELMEAKQKRTQAKDQLEHERQNGPPPMRDLSALVEFASRVIPIEQDLVEELEEELRKKNPQLAALSDKHSNQPKLSLLLNCMGVDEAAIAATRELDSATFKLQTKRSWLLSTTCGSELSDMAFKDLLYCGEMMHDASFPFSEHVEACEVCAQQTPAQLIELIKGLKDVDLPSDVLTNNKINGRRILFCTSDDFPDFSMAQARKAIERLHDIHFDVLLNQTD